CGFDRLAALIAPATSEYSRSRLASSRISSLAAFAYNFRPAKSVTARIVRKGLRRLLPYYFFGSNCRHVELNPERTNRGPSRVYSMGMLSMAGVSFGV